MSAPLRLTPTQMRDIADVLDALTKIREEFGVSVGGYSNAEVRHESADVVLALAWDEALGYTIDDRSGA